MVGEGPGTFLNSLKSGIGINVWVELMLYISPSRVCVCEAIQFEHMQSIGKTCMNV